MSLGITYDSLLFCEKTIIGQRELDTIAITE